jgi:hypothetical protein
MSAYNLRSPSRIKLIPQLGSLNAWFSDEMAEANINNAERLLLNEIVGSLDVFVKWAERPLLLWRGCSRASAYHRYPKEIKLEAKRLGLPLDTRTNGPAVAAFRIAGGVRPARYGSTNSWSVHHLYSGKFPAPHVVSTTWAAKCPLHMTQAAGLVAIHPIADQVCDEYPFFAWFLRAHAFNKFQYDPDGVMAGEPVTELGFSSKSIVETMFDESKK